MTKMPIYYAHELGVDLCLEIALFFFEARRNRGLSIAEAAAKADFPLMMWMSWKRGAAVMILQKSPTCWNCIS